MKNSSKILIAAATGVAVGGTLGLLFANKKESGIIKKIKRFRKFPDLLNGECSKEKLEMIKQKMEKHKERLETHLQRINERIQKAEATTVELNDHV